MILTLSYRGVFRQEQYETGSVEGSVTIDTAYELQGMTPDEVMHAVNRHLDRLVSEKIGQAQRISRYGEDETTVYEWKRVINEASDQAPQHQPRRVHRRG